MNRARLVKYFFKFLCRMQISYCFNDLSKRHKRFEFLIISLIFFATEICLKLSSFERHFDLISHTIIKVSSL